MSQRSVYALGLYLMAVADSPTMLSIGGGVLVGLGVAAGGFGIVLAAFARHVPASSRSFVFGLGTAAGSAGMFVFAPISQGAQKSFANIDTFNILLKGCRTASPPDDQQASFLVSELLALRVVPTSLTYDRLILVFTEAAKFVLRQVRASAHLPESSDSERARGLEMLDWAYRHLADMQPLGWIPRFGTLEMLAVALAKARDERCWEVLQVAEDQGEQIEGFANKGMWLKRNVEEAWREHELGPGESIEQDLEAASA